MKKSESNMIAPPSTSRFTGWGILAAVAGLGMIAFLIVGPMVERHAHLEALDDLDSPERLQRGLLTLCNTRDYLPELNKQLAEKTRDQRHKITVVAREMGCLEKLEPIYKAEHYLWRGEDKESVHKTVSQGVAAVEPAIDALDDEDAIVRRRAMKVLTALEESLDRDQLQRTAKVLDPNDMGQPARALREVLGDLAIRRPPPIAEAPDMGTPDDPTAQADAGDQDMDSEDDAEGDDEGIELGGRGLRLRLDVLGGGAPPRRRAPAPSQEGGGIMLREPSLGDSAPRNPRGVVYSRDQ